MLGIQVKSIATPRRRGLRTFGVVVMMLPMLGRGCLRSAACSCPGGRVLRPSGRQGDPLARTAAPINGPNWPNLLVCAFPDLVPVPMLVPSVLIFMSGEVEVAALARMQLGDEQGSSVRPLVAVLTPLCAMPVPGDFLAASCPLSFPWLATGRRREPN